jgi:hypothetical protein
MLMSGGTPLLCDALPHADPQLEDVLFALLQKDPGLRPQTARDALALLQPLRERYPLPQGGWALQPSAPAEAYAQLRGLEAQALEARAKPLLARSAAERRQAALLLHRASLLAPDATAIRAQLEPLCQEERVAFAPAQSPRILELEQAQRAQPTAAGHQQLASLYKLEGNVERAALHLRRYLRHKPQDGYAAGQLEQLVGAGQAEAGQTMARLLQGIQTGGMKAAPVATHTGVRLASTLPPVAVAPDFVEYQGDAPPSPLAGLLFKVAMVLLAVGFLWLGYRKISNMIDEATRDSKLNLDHVSRDPPVPARVRPRPEPSPTPTPTPTPSPSP